MPFDDYLIAISYLKDEIYVSYRYTNSLITFYLLLLKHLIKQID